MVDWRNLPEGRELDKVVAEKLGYTDLRLSGASGLLWGKRKTDGNDHPFNVDKDGMVDEPLPPYSTKVDAALTLLDTLDGEDGDAEFNLSVSREGGQLSYGAQFDKSNPGGKYSFLAYDVSRMPAFAIVRAWLVWKEMQNG
jgi:hypothetical protein